MKKLVFLSLVLLVSFQFVGCTRDVEKTEAAREPKMTDNQLEEQVQSRINANEDLKIANIDVDANADQNRVTLSGTVATEELRTRAVELARAAHPGVIVEDKVTVKPRELTRAEYTEEHARTEREKEKQYKESIGDSLDDAWIHTKIVAKLVGDTDVSEHKINVDVNNNVVTLRGTVDSAMEAAEAGRIAKETEGVKRVVNQLKVAAKKAS